MGAPQDVLDELMDSSDPRQALTRMLRERTMQAEEGELGRLVERLREEATVLATAARLPEKNDQRHIRALETLSTMVDELATARGPDVALELACMQVTQTIIAARLAVSALLSLPRCLCAANLTQRSAVQVPETVAAMMQDAFEADHQQAVNGAVLPTAMLLLSTLSAHQVCAAPPDPPHSFLITPLSSPRGPPGVSRVVRRLWRRGRHRRRTQPTRGLGGG